MQNMGQSEPAIPDGPMKRQAGQGNNVPLALARPETAMTGGQLVGLTSGGFAPGMAMPAKYSEYADGVSPPLSWNAVPNAKSYALIVEDPDARPAKPFVHWLAWNIPASVTTLPEGLQEQPRLTEPDGVLQGRTTRGSVGYYGPRPPMGEAPHHYHFQLLALDAMLDVPFGASRDDLLRQVAGHVVGKGELVGLYGQKQTPQK